LAVIFLVLGGAQTASALLDNGVDPYHLGKGDWLWVLSDCENNVGTPGNLQGLIDFEKAKGMQYLIVKCADGGQYGSGTTWAQFNSDLITRCHKAGMKIFGFGYVYGSYYGSGQVQAEINAAVACMGVKDSSGVPMDGFMIDAEAEYNGRPSDAITYCQGIRAVYPHRFLAHSPYPIPSNNVSFPYIEFGQYCDAVFPQDYWYDQFSGSGGITPEDMLSRQNSDFIYWQGVWNSNGHAASVKPLIPIGQGFQGYSPTAIPGSQLTRFYNAVKSASPCATAGGYQGISFWSCQHHTAGMWNAIAAMSFLSLPVITNQPASLICTQGNSATFSVLAGPAPLTYQWRKNGSNLSNATNSAFTLTGVSTSDAGGYTVLISNTAGSITSSVATLTILAPPVITAQPQSTGACQGSPGSFTLSATGSLPINYQWRWNNILVLQGTGATSISAYNPGNYWCVLSNQAGMATSAVAALTISYPPAITNQLPSAAVVAQGSCTNLSVGASGTAPLSYSWYWNNQPFAGTASWSACAAGSYWCVVSNSCGMATSAVTVLSVATPPLPGHFEAIDRHTDGSVELIMSGTPGTNYTLLCTSNWLTWPSLGLLPSADGQFHYTDLSATNAAIRFYRLRLGPN
jgi:hypothetical protein